MVDSHDDRTVIAPGPATQPQVSDDNPLQPGTRLNEFEIVGLVGIGGFGIVYLAEDHSLGRRVALKEYMPSTLAARAEGVHVTLKSQRHAETFEAGRRSFVNEARLLAQFDHPALVKVYRFWEANGTAYMVMPYYEGSTLKHALQQMPQPPDEAWLLRLLAPVLDALELMHGAQVFHRDIAPDNILLLAGDRPLLLDFGAARHVISDMTQALTVILKPGFAPVEQYAEMPELKQGAWTDIYALAAVIYLAIVGRTPPPAVGRMMNDTMQPLAQQAAGRYSDAFLRAVDAGLAVKPADRPQSIAAFRTRLGIERGVPPGAPWQSTAKGTSPQPVRPSQTARWPLLAAAMVALMVLGGGAYYLLKAQAPARNPVPPPRETASAIAAEHPSSQPETASLANAVEPGALVAAPQSATALDELDRIFDQRNREHSVTVALDKAQVRIGRDRLSFRVNSSKPGYLYVLMIGTDRQHFYKLFPNAVDTANRIDAGETVTLPRRGWLMEAGGPPGANQFIAVVSEQTRDFSGIGMLDVDPFAEFPPAAIAGLLAERRGAQSPFLGAPVCPRNGGCSGAYGAAMFTIVEVD